MIQIQKENIYIYSYASFTQTQPHTRVLSFLSLRKLQVHKLRISLVSIFDHFSKKYMFFRNCIDKIWINFTLLSGPSYRQMWLDAYRNQNNNAFRWVAVSSKLLSLQLSGTKSQDSVQQHNC